MKNCYTISIIRGPRKDLGEDLALVHQEIEYDFDEANRLAISLAKEYGSLDPDDKIIIQIMLDDCYKWRTDDTDWSVHVRFIEIDE